MWWPFLFLATTTRAVIHHEGQQLPVIFKKTWPRSNPSETYAVPSILPICAIDIPSHKSSLGQLLTGVRPYYSPFVIPFNKPITAPKVACEGEIGTQKQLKTLIQAIQNDYIIEFDIDNLPYMRRIGHIGDNGKYYLATNWNFRLGWNSDQIVSADVFSKEDTDFVEILPKTQEQLPLKLTWTYTVDWVPSNMTHSNQIIDNLSDTSLQIHWLGIGNSFILVLLVTLTLFLIILRSVRSAVARQYLSGDSPILEDDSGWKLLHADVFRSPPHKMWLCAMVGSGAHLLLTGFGTALFAAIQIANNRSLFATGSVTASSIGLSFYLMTSAVSGYISANLYRRLGGVKWKWNVLVTVFMFTGPLALIWSIVNIIALTYHSTAALPFRTTLFLATCWLCITFPLLIIGAIIGRRHANLSLERGKKPFPCRANRLAREIPRSGLTASPWLHSVLAGLLPFSAIYMELHYVFRSLWGHQMYTLYGILMIAFTLSLAVAGVVSMILTYLHLNMEDYRWWWRSFISGGSMAYFFLGFCLVWYAKSTNMHGMLQAALFAGYSIIAAWGLFLAVGFVSFSCNYALLTYLYSQVKCE